MKVDKKIVFFVCAAGLLLWYPFSRGDSKTTIDQMKEALTTVIDETAYHALDEKELRKYFNIESSEVAGYFGYRSNDTMSAETLLIIRLQNAESAETIKQKLNVYIKNEHKKYDGYSIDQVRILDNYNMIEKKGFIFLSISDNEEWKHLFEKNL